jgi:hypothetical protein
VDGGERAFSRLSSPTRSRSSSIVPRRKRLSVSLEAESALYRDFREDASGNEQLADAWHE